MDPFGFRFRKIKAEKEGFEPSRRLRDLSDFKSDTFSHLVTSPFGVQMVL